MDSDFILSYHNLTPAGYFRSWDPMTADLLTFGRATLGMLSDRTVLALADSAFNADDLVRAGYGNVHVGGLLLDVAALARVAPDEQVLHEASGHKGPTVLSVGQLYPHKRHNFTLSSFAVLVRESSPSARLVLVGASRLARYGLALEQFAVELGISERVSFAGSVTQPVLAAHYRTADLLVSASEHEGFCVPLVEAMSFDVPIIARPFGAVPETVGDAGLILPPEASADGMAAAIAGLLDDQVLADEFRRRGAARIEDFSLGQSSHRFLELVETVL